MDKETNRVRRAAGDDASLDGVDRRILTLLAEDAGRSYADLSAQLHLSAPAIHERVKRMKRTGVIRKTVALLDGAKAGRPILAFVHLETADWETTRQVLTLGAREDIEEIHTVAGDTAMILKVRTESTASLEQLLGELHRTEGFRGVKTFVALGTYLERGPLPGRPADGHAAQ